MLLFSVYYVLCCVKNMLLLFSALVTVQLIGHVHVYALTSAAALTAVWLGLVLLYVHRGEVAY